MTARTVIAFDYGTRRIGIAIGQELTKTASPLTTLRLTGKAPPTDPANAIDWTAIDEIIRDWQPQAAVVGLPLMADGGETDVTRGAKAFGEQLQKRYNLETYWIDERLTSVEAERMIAASPLGGKRNKQSRNSQNRQNRKSSPKSKSSMLEAKEEIDRMAAKIILENWFSQQ